MRPAGHTACQRRAAGVPPGHVRKAMALHQKYSAVPKRKFVFHALGGGSNVLPFLFACVPQSSSPQPNSSSSLPGDACRTGANARSRALRRSSSVMGAPASSQLLVPES
jgi:hypothetical protein